MLRALPQWKGGFPAARFEGVYLTRLAKGDRCDLLWQPAQEKPKKGETPPLAGNASEACAARGWTVSVFRLNPGRFRGRAAALNRGGPNHDPAESEGGVLRYAKNMSRENRWENTKYSVWGVVCVYL